MDVPDASPNVISGKTSLSIDLRHPEEATLIQLEALILNEMDKISHESDDKIKFDLKRIWHSPAQDFDPVLLHYIEKAATASCGDSNQVQRLRSHAGHDSALVALSGCPVAMIFVPSRNGISHSPEEWTDKEDW